MNHPFLKAVPVIEKLEKANFEAYFVGGSVRNYLLQREIEDIDIATSATPEEVKRIFHQTVDLGIEHGTVLVLFENMTYEITTFRTEAEYKDFRRPKGVTFIRSLEEDLRRRDFTMNAIAMDKNGKIIDPFAGKRAILKREIVTVGSAEARFKEDALRMMRAVRFVSQLQFTIEENTKRALIEYGYLLTKIAIERIANEFEKLLIGEGSVQALRLLVETRLHHHLPGLAEKGDGIIRMTNYQLDKLSLDELWTLLLFSCEISVINVEKILRKWKLSLKQIKQVKLLLSSLHNRLHNEWTKEQLYRTGRENIEKIERLYCVITNRNFSSIFKWLSQYDRLPIKERSELDANGKDLMEWLNQKGGPWLKQLLAEIETSVVEGNLANRKEVIKEWVRKCNRS